MDIRDFLCQSSIIHANVDIHMDIQAWISMQELLQVMSVGHGYSRMDIHCYGYVFNNSCIH